MPLDGTDDTLLARLENENPQTPLRQEMFELRPPLTRRVNNNGSLGRELIKLITKRDVIGLVGLCSDHGRLMAQNAEVVTCPTGYVYREFTVNGRQYFTPHGFIDWYVNEAIGHYPGCHRALKDDARIYLGILERHHASIYRLRHKAFGQERELQVLLEAIEPADAA